MVNQCLEFATLCALLSGTLPQDSAVVGYAIIEGVFHTPSIAFRCDVLGFVPACNVSSF